MPLETTTSGGCGFTGAAVTLSPASHDAGSGRRRGLDLIVTADDFGLSESVNEGIERAHRDGILTSASLMVAGPAAADAVRRARAMPGLRVGLHLVVIEGPAMLPATEIPALVDWGGMFPSDQLGLGWRYFARPAVRAQLAAEIRAQFAAFSATGLVLDHADAHKHMHLHPVVGAMMLRIGREFGLRAVRVPTEPGWVVGGGGALRAWSRVLRRQVRRAGMVTSDRMFGLGWSGGMTEARVLSLIARLPPGVSELYFHPAVGRDARIAVLMPGYDHEGELAALVSPAVRAALAARDVRLCGFGDLA